MNGKKKVIGVLKIIEDLYFICISMGFSLDLNEVLRINPGGWALKVTEFVEFDDPIRWKGRHVHCVALKTRLFYIICLVRCLGGGDVFIDFGP